MKKFQSDSRFAATRFDPSSKCLDIQAFIDKSASLRFLGVESLFLKSTFEGLEIEEQDYEADPKWRLYRITSPGDAIVYRIVAKGLEIASG
jgi:hypothetical protein